MFRGRIVWIGIAALVIIGLLMAGGQALQQNAWTQGYLIGRLTATSADGAAAAAPLVPYGYGYGYPSRGPGFGGFLFLLLGAGAIFFFFSRAARWRAWAMQAAATGEGFQGPPWMHHRMRHSCHEQQAGEQAPAQATETVPAPVEPTQEPPAR